MAKSRAGPLFSMDDIKKALNTDLKKDGSRWESIRDGFMALADKLKKAADPSSVLSSGLQKEIAAAWVAALTNERSALVNQAKTTLIFATDLMGYQLKDLADRMLYPLIKQTGSGNGTNAAHATEVVICLMKYVPSVLMFNEVIKAKTDFGANQLVQLTCHRAVNILLATWPQDILYKIQNNAVYENEMIACLIGGLNAGSEVVRRLARVNFRVLRRAWPETANKIEEKWRTKLPDKWDFIINDASCVAEDEVKLRAALDVRSPASAARDDPRTPAFYTDTIHISTDEHDTIIHDDAADGDIYKAASPVKTASPRFVVDHTAAPPVPKGAVPPMRSSRPSHSTSASAAAAAVNTEALKLLAKTPTRPDNDGRATKLSRSPRQARRVSPTVSPKHPPPTRGIVPPAGTRKLSEKTIDIPAMPKFVRPADTAFKVADELHVHVRQHVGYVAKAYEKMIQAETYTQVAKRLTEIKKKKSEMKIQHFNAASRDLHTGSDPLSAVERVMQVAEMDLEEETVDPSQLSAFSSSLLSSLLDLRQQLNDMITHVEESVAFNSLLPVTHVLKASSSNVLPKNDASLADSSGSLPTTMSAASSSSPSAAEVPSPGGSVGPHELVDEVEGSY